MDTTKAQQIALDDALVAPDNHALKLTPFYKAFEVTANVPEIYMQEFWATVSLHHKSLRFKMNDKSHTVNLENFRDMLQIFPRLPGQKFEDPPFEEEILSFIRDLGHTREIKVLTDVNVNHMHQPWRSFAAIINRCLSGKTTGLDSLRLSRAQIIWGMYHKKNVDYVYLLWEDLVYQVENKNSKKNNDMCYPRFTKVIIDYFMSKDQSISRRNKMFWHTARDDPMIPKPTSSTTPSHLEQNLQTKTKYKKKADRSDTSSKPKSAPTVKGKRLKTPGKVTNSCKKRQSASVQKAKGIETLSKVALSEHEQMKIATKRSKTQFHSSYISGSGDGADTQSETFSQGDDDDDNDEHELEDEKDDEDDDDKNDSEETESDDDGDDFVHPNLLTYKVGNQEEEKADDDDEVSSDQRVSTPPDHEFTEEEEKQEGDDYVKE
ncbi:hypothetical protein Tco_1098150 [Tanacetum coccineum]